MCVRCKSKRKDYFNSISQNQNNIAKLYKLLKIIENSAQAGMGANIKRISYKLYKIVQNYTNCTK